MEQLNILLLGSGGREHALIKAVAQSPRAGKIYAAPANAGIDQLAEVVELAIEDPLAVVDFATSHFIDVVIIGPEAPLVAGVADAVRAAHITCFGPNADAARLEGSKKFAKQIMSRAGVPTAAWRSFTDEASASDYVKKTDGHVVVKADGLAAGKGVFVANSVDEALEGIHECFSGVFGDSGTTVVIEEMLSGPEVSLLALTDGTTLIPLATSQDHKRALDGDKGPNTGGMGVYSPVPCFTDEELAQMVKIEEDVLAALRAEGITYSGCLYGGFMLTENGPMVLEFNARFGDPETQVVVPRMEGDLLELMCACDRGNLNQYTDKLSWNPGWAVSVVLTSAGYPGSYQTGFEITGIEDAEQDPRICVYHAGTKHDEAGRVVTAGGRVLAVTAVAPSFEEAQEAAYAACKKIQFEGKTYRTDIGAKAFLQR